MDKKFYTDNFERLLKEKSDEFKMIPSKRVWHSIYNDLHPSRRWPSVAMSLLLVGALLFTGYLNTKTQQHYSSAKQTGAGNKTVVAANTNTGNTQPTESSINGNTSQVTGSTDDLLANNSATIGTSNSMMNPVTQNPAITGTSKLPFVQQPATSSNHSNSIAMLNARPIHSTSSNNSNNNINTRNRNVRSVNLDVIADLDRTNPRHTANPGTNNAAINSSNNPISDISRLVNDKISSSSSSSNPEENTDVDNNSASQYAVNIPAKTSLQNSPVLNNEEKALQNEAVQAGSKENTTKTESTVQASPLMKNNIAATEQKAWMEDYAFHNKPILKKWKGKLSWEVYATPALTFRNVMANSSFNTLPVANSVYAPGSEPDLSYKPSVGIELGGSLILAFSKKFRLNTGIQFSYTNYSVKAWESNHPVQTTITLNDLNSGFPYLDSRSTSLSSAGGTVETRLHNKTYQVGVSVGLDYKLFENERIKWFLGLHAQPSWVAGGKAYLLSTDKRNYIADPSLLNKFSMAGSFETFVSYKMGSYTWQVGPNLRYQFLNTYDKKYTQRENLLNAGFKVGIVKLF